MKQLPNYSDSPLPPVPTEEVVAITPQEPLLVKEQKPSGRITSIDAARGFIMLTMIYVNDLAGAPGSAHVPTWMMHADDALDLMRRNHVNPLPAQDWLTFVDLVFPGFLFIVGMSIPFAIGGRLNKGERWWQILPHVAFRTFALLLLGMLMAAGSPDGTKMPWYRAPVLSTPATASATVGSAPASAPKMSDDDKEKLSEAKQKAGEIWIVGRYAAAFMAFCSLLPFWVKKDDAAGKRLWWWISVSVRVIGAAALLWLILIYAKSSVNRRTHVESVRHLLTFSPFQMAAHEATFRGWLGAVLGGISNMVVMPYRNSEILGLIAWAYLGGAVVFLAFRNRRLPLAICCALMLGFWTAEFSGSFNDFSLPGILHPLGEWIDWIVSGINNHVSLAGELGSQAAITVAGVLLATILWKPKDVNQQVGPTSVWGRTKFTLWFVVAVCIGAMLLHKPYLVWKDPATPSWCLYACGATALVWLVFYLLGDVLKLKWLTLPFALAGANVLMAYLFSEGAEALFNLLHISAFYDHLGSPTLSAAISRSLGFGIFLLALTVGLNWLGFRLRL